MAAVCCIHCIWTRFCRLHHQLFSITVSNICISYRREFMAWTDSSVVMFSLRRHFHTINHGFGFKFDKNCRPGLDCCVRFLRHFTRSPLHWLHAIGFLIIILKSDLLWEVMSIKYLKIGSCHRDACQRFQIDVPKTWNDNWLQPCK